MNKFIPLALLATVATFAAVPTTLHASEGSPTTAVSVVAGKAELRRG